MYSVNITNSSGAPQNVAIFVADASGGGDFSLVWKVKTIGAGVTALFCWDATAFGLGWGRTSRPVDIGVRYVSGQLTAPFYPSTSGGNNILPVQYQNNDFVSGAAYYDSGINAKLVIVTDTSFTVIDSLTMCVALYIDAVPAIVMQGTPNNNYYFVAPQLSYYLTVTDVSSGVVLPVINSQDLKDSVQRKISVTSPTRMAFSAGVTDLSYSLNGNLMFIRS